MTTPPPIPAHEGEVLPSITIGTVRRHSGAFSPMIQNYGDKPWPLTDESDNVEYVPEAALSAEKQRGLRAVEEAGLLLGMLEDAMQLLDYASFEHRVACNWDAAVPECTCGAWKLMAQTEELVDRYRDFEEAQASRAGKEQA